MTPERWEQVKNVCYAVLDCDPAGREALLDALCSGDEELRREVTAMMADAARDDSLLERPAWEVLGVAADAPAGDVGGKIPEAIGRYRPLRVIGEGGMGVVYEARQVEPERTVALKVIKPGLAGRDVLRRFRRESQALARLQHPGIAQIFDAGTADTGQGPQPYFAMELIHGESLREHVEHRRPGVAERLDIMARVCDAVDHAHQRGLIHRDLKPANILIDESGQPKILDFGVARATDADLQKTQQTDLGELVGTLAYMSPEQVLADPSELDTRSDVYALGVILYELLAGSLPYTIGRRVHEAARTIQFEDPRRLSSIDRKYRGDLETIVAKALEKEKSRRYPSAAALAADIRRYLQHEPIAARPPSATYQLRKFARRHRALVTGVVAVFVALSAGIVATTREALRARRAERAAVAAEQNAQAVSEFLQTDLLAQAGATVQARPGIKPDPNLTVRTALDRAAAKVGGKFAAQPSIEASIRRTIGRAYADLGLYPHAQQHLERALELRRGLYGEDHPEVLDLLEDLAKVHALAGRYDLAEPLHARTADARRRLLGEEHPATLGAVENLALLYDLQGKPQQAEPLLAKSVEVRRRVSGDEHPETLNAMNVLANAYHNLGRYEEAEALLTKALETSRRVKGDEHPETAALMNDLSSVYRQRGRPGEAVSILSRALDIWTRSLGEEHLFTLTAMGSLAGMYSAQGKNADAERLLTRALEIHTRVLGESHTSTMLTMNNLALALGNQGEYARAQALLERALQVRQQVSGPDHPETVRVMSNLGFLYRLAGQYPQARVMFERAHEAGLRTVGPNHPDTVRDLERLALVHESERRLDRAEELWASVVDARRRVQGDVHPATIRASFLLGRVQFIRHRLGEAVRTLRSTLEMYDKASPDSWQRFSCQRLLGAALAAQKKYAEAEPLLVSGYEGMVRVESTMPAYERRSIEEAKRDLLRVYRATGREIPERFR